MHHESKVKSDAGENQSSIWPAGDRSFGVPRRNDKKRNAQTNKAGREGVAAGSR